MQAQELGGLYVGGLSGWGVELVSHNLPALPGCQSHASLPICCPIPVTVNLLQNCEAPVACGPGSEV